MISSLSTLADRYFVIGFLLPVILAAIFFLTVFQDVGPVGDALATAMDAESFGKVTMLILGIWTAAVLLSIFNVPLYQVLEGYTCPLNSAARKQSAKAAYAIRSKALDKLYLAASKDAPGSPSWTSYYTARREFAEDYPPEAALLPTRFGNTVRAAEAYSLEVYGVDSIKAWLRLISVVPDSFQNVINGARAEVDFFVNACFLLLALATASAVALSGTVLLSCPPFGTMDLVRLCAIPTGYLLAWAAYEAAISRAKAWGHVVRGTFDLYLPALASQLGYRLPDDLDGRLAFWTAMSRLFIDAKPIDPKSWPGKDPQGH